MVEYSLRVQILVHVLVEAVSVAFWPSRGMPAEPLACSKATATAASPADISLTGAAGAAGAEEEPSAAAAVAGTAWEEPSAAGAAGVPGAAGLAGAAGSTGAAGAPAGGVSICASNATSAAKSAAGEATAAAPHLQLDCAHPSGLDCRAVKARHGLASACSTQAWARTRALGASRRSRSRGGSGSTQILLPDAVHELSVVGSDAVQCGIGSRGRVPRVGDVGVELKAPRGRGECQPHSVAVVRSGLNERSDLGAISACNGSRTETRQQRSCLGCSIDRQRLDCHWLDGCRMNGLDGMVERQTLGMTVLVASVCESWREKHKQRSQGG